MAPGEFANPAGSERGASPLFDPDYRALIGRSDLHHTGMIPTGTQGIPVANGRFGGPVWQSDDSTLVMQLNHTDAFMFNEASSASKDHPNAGGGALGRVHLGLGATAAFDDATTQWLSLYAGTLRIVGAGVSIEVVPDVDADVIALRVTDDRPSPQPVTIDVAMLRDANQVWGAHTATSAFDTIPDDGDPGSRSETIVLEQVIQEKADTGIGVNDFFCTTALAVTVQGRTVSTVADGTIGGRATRRLTLPAQKGSFTVIIGGAATVRQPGDPLRDLAVGNATRSEGFGDISARTQGWWSDFWQKSYVYVPSQFDYEQRRNYYMYLAAISNRGSFPSKYNGGIWIGEEDRRDWGAFYWNWNQDPLYQPLMAANHVDLMDPLFAMRDSGYAQYEVAAQQMWGSKGVFIGETAGVLGWETLPADLAASLRDYLAFASAAPAAALVDIAARRNTFIPAWNWNVFGEINQASFVPHIMMATQETAEHYWSRYLYTKDLDWLRDSAYPFITGAADFYQFFGGLRKEGDGKYHFNNTNLHEHIWAGKDVIDDLAMARGIFAVAVQASILLGVDADRRAGWQEILDDLAGYPLRTDPDALWAGTDDPELAERLATDEPAWAQGRRPAFLVRGEDGTESPILRMLEKFDILNLESRDQGLDNGDWDIALNTYLHSPGYLNQVKSNVIDRNGSSRFHIDAAKLGRADDMVPILNTQYGVFSTYGQFPNLLFDQGDYYSAEGYGTFATALQEMLNQSLSPTPVGDPVIRVFPAWPSAWDAKYKLLAKDGFLVSSSIASGDIQYVELESQLGETARIRNPWDTDVILYRNGKAAERLAASKNELLEFATRPGERIVLLRPGTTPEMYAGSDVLDTR